MAKIIRNHQTGSIHGRAGNYIFYNVKGRQYIKSYTIPHNPRTGKQQKNRLAFAECVKQWQRLPQAEKNLLSRMAEGKPLSGYNLFLSLMMREIRPELVIKAYKLLMKKLLTPVPDMIRDSSVSPSLTCHYGSIYPGKPQCICCRLPGMNAPPAYEAWPEHYH